MNAHDQDALLSEMDDAVSIISTATTVFGGIDDKNVNELREYRKTVNSARRQLTKEFERIKAMDQDDFEDHYPDFDVQRYSYGQSVVEYVKLAREKVECGMMTHVTLLAVADSVVSMRAAWEKTRYFAQHHSMPDIHFPTYHDITNPAVVPRGGDKRQRNELSTAAEAPGDGQSRPAPRTSSPIPIDDNRDVGSDVFATPNHLPAVNHRNPTYSVKRELLHPHVNVQLTPQPTAAGTDVKTPVRARRQNDADLQALRQQLEDIKSTLNTKVQDAVAANTKQVQAAANAHYQEEIMQLKQQSEANAKLAMEASKQRDDMARFSEQVEKRAEIHAVAAAKEMIEKESDKLIARERQFEQEMQKMRAASQADRQALRTQHQELERQKSEFTNWQKRAEQQNQQHQHQQKQQQGRKSPKGQKEHPLHADLRERQAAADAAKKAAAAEAEAAAAFAAASSPHPSAGITANEATVSSLGSSSDTDPKKDMLKAGHQHQPVDSQRLKIRYDDPMHGSYVVGELSGEAYVRMKQLALERARDARPAEKFSSGSSVEYTMHMTRFEQATNNSAMDSGERLEELLHWFAGPALKIVRNHSIKPDKAMALAAAKSELDVLFKEHRDSFTSTVKRLIKGKQIDQNDYHEHLKLYSDLREAQMMISSTGNSSEFNRRDVIQDILDHRLSHLADRFYSEDEKSTREKGIVFGFEQFMDEMQRWLTILTNKGLAAGKKPTPQVAAVATKTAAGKKPTYSQQLVNSPPKEQPPLPKRIVEKCNICRCNHATDACPKLHDIDTDARVQLLANHRLCFHCFSGNHIARACEDRPQCAKCGKRHATLLHDRKFTPATATLNPEALTFRSASDAAPATPSSSSATPASVNPTI